MNVKLVWYSFDTPTDIRCLHSVTGGVVLVELLVSWQWLLTSAIITVVIRRRLIAKSLPDIASIDKLPYTNYDYSYVSILYTRISLSVCLSVCLSVSVCLCVSLCGWCT